MGTKRSWTVAGLVLGISVLCLWPAGAGLAGTEPKPGTPTKPVVRPVVVGVGETVLEVETFKLTAAEVKPLAGAGGGKAVLFPSEASSAELALMVKKGTYELVAYVQAADPDHDAFYLALGATEVRLYPDDYGKVLPTKVATIEVKQDGPTKLTLMAAETGMHLDKVVIRTKPVEVGEGQTVLEVEDFKLIGAEVKALTGASGGKAVLFATDTSGAELAVTVKKGTYEVVAYVQAADEDHDAFYLAFAGTEERLFPDDYDKVLPTKAFTVEVKQDGPAKVTLMAAESGVYLDKVVIKKVK